jgi:nucleoside-diphosphate-sugar epimerase
MTEKFTILGGTGFIGSNLSKFLESENNIVYTPDIRKSELGKNNLGNIIYCIGVPNFLENPFKAIEAHSCLLKKILESTRFDSFLYISSGRIYYNFCKTTKEDNEISVNPHNQNDLYNISKILGESICMSSKKENIKIIRPSNVTGNSFTSNLFIPSIIRNAIEENKIKLFSTLDSEKDYILIEDLVKMIPKILLNGKEDIYNLAEGRNTTVKEIIDKILAETKCEIEIDKNAKKNSSMQINIERITDEFDYKPNSIINKLPDIIKDFKKWHSLNQKL